MAVQNRNKVPKKQWTKWNQKEIRLMFNGLYESMMNDPELFKHPKAEPMAPKYWKTISWNAAWIAADILNMIFYPED